MMASHGRSGMSGVLLGSETAKVLAHSKIGARRALAAVREAAEEKQ